MLTKILLLHSCWQAYSADRNFWLGQTLFFWNSTLLIPVLTMPHSVNMLLAVLCLSCPTYSYFWPCPPPPPHIAAMALPPGTGDCFFTHPQGSQLTVAPDTRRWISSGNTLECPQWSMCTRPPNSCSLGCKCINGVGKLFSQGLATKTLACCVLPLPRVWRLNSCCVRAFSTHFFIFV